MNARFGEESNRQLAGDVSDRRTASAESTPRRGIEDSGWNFGADSTTRCSDDEGKCFGADTEV